jgi:hypothetical protein
MKTGKNIYESAIISTVAILSYILFSSLLGCATTAPSSPGWHPGS